MPEAHVDATAQLPASLASAATARRLVRETLGPVVADDDLYTIELLTSEVVTNAVLHAGASPTLEVTRRGHKVRVSVQDETSGWPVPRAVSSQALSGRGLALVDRLATEWGVERMHPQGKRIWFELHSGRPVGLRPT